MHKTNSATHLKMILSDVIKKAMDHLSDAASVAQSLKKDETLKRLLELNSLELTTEQQELKFKVESLGYSIDMLDDKERKEKIKLQDNLRFLSLVEGLLDAINDIIHPAYDVMANLCHDVTNMEKHVELLRKNRDIAINRKVINSTCKCYSCKQKQPIA